MNWTGLKLSLPCLRGAHILPYSEGPLVKFTQAHFKTKHPFFLLKGSCQQNLWNLKSCLEPLMPFNPFVSAFSHALNIF